MLRHSQVVAAFGRRLFDEEELKETSSEDEEKDEYEKVNHLYFKQCSNC
jgi:hypothetical protein